VASRPKFWPQPRPRVQTFGLGLASISLSYYVIKHFSSKNRVKFQNFVNFSGNNLKSYVVNHYLVLFFIIIYRGLGLNLQKLALALAW